jgi:hypothetical protein
LAVTEEVMGEAALAVSVVAVSEAAALQEDGDP